MIRTLSPNLVLVCLCLLAGSIGCGDGTTSAPPSDPRIVGKWSAVGSEYPLTNEYRANGTLVQHVRGAATNPHPYRIEGNQLIVSIKQPDGTNSETKARFELNDSTLTLVDEDEFKTVFRRE